jgi:NAD(P)-dependent dehydrogenase (short-subunit alcohol dehydrogenase family)
MTLSQLNPVERHLSLRGQRIVTLGGTSGIGRAVTQAALEEGASVLVASSHSEHVERTRAEMAEHPEFESDIEQLDVTSEVSIRDFFDRVGPFDHLVYTAGDNLPLGPLVDTELQRARARFEVRFWGAVAAVKYGVRWIRPEGSIVLTSGFSAIRPRAGWTSQASIQSAVEGLTRALAVELGPIRVNCVSPGLARTPRWDAWNAEDREAFYSAEERRLPLARVGTAEELASAYIYLMKNTYATGNVLNVDGGGALV